MAATTDVGGCVAARSEEDVPGTGDWSTLILGPDRINQQRAACGNNAEVEKTPGAHQELLQARVLLFRACSKPAANSGGNPC